MLLDFMGSIDNKFVSQDVVSEARRIVNSGSVDGDYPLDDVRVICPWRLSWRHVLYHFAFPRPEGGDGELDRYTGRCRVFDEKPMCEHASCVRFAFQHAPPGNIVYLTQDNNLDFFVRMVLPGDVTLPGMRLGLRSPPLFSDNRKKPPDIRDEVVTMRVHDPQDQYLALAKGTLRDLFHYTAPGL